MENRYWKGSILLLLAALIWGAAFVAQKIGIVEIGTFTFSATRFAISGLVLLPIALMRRKSDASATASTVSRTKGRKTLIIGGILCGVCLALATNAQQMGISDTSAGKAGFITALYIVFVPILRIFSKKSVSTAVWISVAVAVAGFYLLSVKEGISINKGDAIVLLSALLFSFHILVIDKYSPRADGIKISCIQSFTAAGISAVCMLIFEQPSLSAILAGWAPILGVVSGAIGYTLQIIGQKYAEPSSASLILSLESVFAAVMGVIFLGEGFTAKELIGCVLVFGAIILSQISISKKAFSNRIAERDSLVE
jgi:drug/metabolite transporter (DMT)-like permease